MTDLAPFSEEGFDPVAWVNAAVAEHQQRHRAAGATGAPQPQGEQQQQHDGAQQQQQQQQQQHREQQHDLEKFLAELEMRLQLAAEELDASLAETSAAALRRVPLARQEARRLKADAAVLAGAARAALPAAAANAAAASAAAAPVARLHAVKERMEAAGATLREAAELSGAFRRVEELFAAGDLPRVAELLRAMGRSLAVVGSVPEFKEGRARLAALEDRLQRRVEGRLADALASAGGAGGGGAGSGGGGGADEAGALAGVLLAVGRGGALERLYVAGRLPRAQAAWEAALAGAGAGSAGDAAAAPGAAAAAAAPGGLGGGALQAANAALLRALEAESGWLAGHLPEQRAQLLAALSTAALAAVARPLREWLAGLSSTAPLRGLLSEALQLAKGLQALLRSAGAGEAAVAAAVRAALEPFEEQVRGQGNEVFCACLVVLACLGWVCP